MLTRRHVLAGTTALGLSARSFARDADVDVAIIGAGVAGLSAARQLRALGRSFVVLEARNRIGGRAWTDNLQGVPIDRGAHWLHNAEINPLVPVAKRMGLKLTASDRAQGWMFDAPGVVSTAPHRDLARSDAALERAIARLPRHATDRSLAVLGQGPATLAATLIAFAIGEKPDDVSAHDVGALEDGTDLEIAGGLGAFVARYGADVPVRLGAVVERIDWGGAGVTIIGRFGSVRARTCLITVPPGVLAADDGLRFDPLLPAAKTAAFNALPMGNFTKVALLLDRPALDLPVYSIDAGRFEAGSLHVLHHTGGGVATLLLAGDTARAAMDAGEAAAIAQARDVLAAVAGSDAAAGVRGGMLCAWRDDPFARGSYAFVRPSAGIPAGTPRDDYATPVAGRLFFAGDTAGGAMAMTVGGAHRSALAAVAAINTALRQ